MKISLGEPKSPVKTLHQHIVLKKKKRRKNGELLHKNSKNMSHLPVSSHLPGQHSSMPRNNSWLTVSFMKKRKEW
jgi:hypothetical protein